MHCVGSDYFGPGSTGHRYKPKTMLRYCSSSKKSYTPRVPEISCLLTFRLFTKGQWVKSTSHVTLTSIVSLIRFLAFFVPNPGRYGQSRNTWNEGLQKAMDEFATSHDDATVLFFSSSETFTKLIDNPSRYGFSEGAVQQFGGSMWRDHIHPTSRVHDFIAHDIAAFLDGA